MGKLSVQPAAGSASARILAVDDEPTILSLVQRVLVRARYHVDTAVDRHQALELLRQHRYDLLLSDVHRPGLSGMELLTHCRQEHPGVKVILIAGMACSTRVCTSSRSRSAVMHWPQDCARCWQRSAEVRGVPLAQAADGADCQGGKAYGHGARFRRADTAAVRTTTTAAACRFGELHY